jgi:hypothetical protein
MVSSIKIKVSKEETLKLTAYPVKFEGKPTKKKETIS